MTDFLEEKRKQITDRLNDLKPVVEEYRRLEAAASALAGVAGAAPAAATTTTAARRRGPGRPRGSSNPAATAPVSAAAPARATHKTVGRPSTGKKPGRPLGRRGGRRKGSGQRGAEALALIQGEPGIAIPEISTKMGIKQNYLYRVLPKLEKEGKVHKDGRGWHPRQA